LFVTCTECGAELRLNPKLAGTAVSCPQCGERVQVPKGEAAVRVRAKARPRLQIEDPDPAPARERTRAPAPAAPKRPHEPFTFWMLAAQAVLFLLALSCVWGGFRVGGWEPPHWSYFAEHEFALIGAAVALVFTGFMVRYLPVTSSLGGVLVVCAGIFLGHQFAGHKVDATRTIALSMSLLAVWLALEHRKMTH
jgi:DNA-directed RNA polymerase subunit RPC12/RpoP